MNDGAHSIYNARGDRALAPHNLSVSYTKQKFDKCHKCKFIHAQKSPQKGKKMYRPKGLNPKSSRIFRSEILSSR